VSTDDTPPRVKDAAEWTDDAVPDIGQARESDGEPDEDAIRAADLCKVAAWLVANPQGSATWLNSVPSQARAHLATWLRTEEVLFRTDASRGSPIGFPSWHFAQTVHVQHNHVSSGVYGGCPACGTDWDLSAPSGDTGQAPNPLDGADDLPAAVRIQLKDRRDVVEVLREYGHTADEQHVAASVRAALRGQVAEPQESD
jgi:hypothetical protein